MLKLIGLAGIIVGLALACAGERGIGLVLLIASAVLTWRAERGRSV